MAQLMLVNPKKRKKKAISTGRFAKARKRLASARTSVSTGLKRIRRSYKRNPIGGGRADIITQFKDGAVGAVGALAVDVAMSKLPIPDNLKSGQLKPIVQGLVGIGIGMMVANFGKNRSLGKQLAGGAVTVSLYNAGRQMLAPTLGLSGYDDGLLAYEDMGAYEDTLFGADSDLDAYSEDNMGFYSAGPISDE